MMLFLPFHLSSHQTFTFLIVVKVEHIPTMLWPKDNIRKWLKGCECTHGDEII